MRDPQSDADWREAVDSAAFLLAIHSAVMYGLLKTDTKIDVARCEQILESGRKRNFFPIGVDGLIRKYLR